MVRLTLRQCSYLAAVAEHGSIAEAARTLNMSQPAVAQALDKLEETYGLQLFARQQARGSELTPQGRAFCQSARDLLGQAERTEQAALAIAADLAGTIRLGCFHTIAPFYLTGLIKAHQELYPGVTIQASELLQDEIVSGMRTAELDIALTYDMSLDAREFECRLLASLKAFIILSRDHPFASRSSIALAEMAQEPFVMFDGPSSRDYFEGLLSAHGVRPPIAFSSRSMESVRCAVANGLGFSLNTMRPRHDMTYDGGNVVVVPIADEIEPLPIVLVRKKESPTSSLIDNLVQTCRGHF